MRAFDRAKAYLGEISRTGTSKELGEAMGAIAREIGFAHFALSHHVDIRRAGGASIRLHNYPDDWVEYYDSQNLGASDPVRRASCLTSVGFAWSKIPDLVRLSAADRQILERAELSGIGDGFTVPAHVPGESNGSCSFANPRGAEVPTENFPIAQLVGSFGFEAARRLWRVRSPAEAPMPLTERQRECVIWMARGKSDWEISQILGIRHETVIAHLKQARDRYGVSKRTMLAIQALFDGAICFNDIMKR